MLRLLMAMCAMLLAPLGARALETQSADRVGDTYEIRVERVSENSGGRSSGSSRSINTLVERVIALGDSGVELEFDLPEGTSAQDRAREWQFPVRVQRSEQELRLLNALELERRARAWRDGAGLTESACGRWIFTWTAVKIECDPQSVLQALEPFDLRPSDLRDGAQHSEIGARPAPFRIESQRSGGATFVAEMELDPDVTRRQRAEMDVAVAEMTGHAPLSLETALEARAAERISGTIVTTFETDAAGRVTRRTRVTRAEIAGADGSLERHITTETAERRLVSQR